MKMKEKIMGQETYTQANRAMELTTPLGPDVLLLAGLTGREGISQLFQLQLDLLAENGREVAFDKLLGQPVAVRLALGGGKHRYFHGIVSRFSQGMRDETFTSFRAEVVPRLWLLTRRVQSRIFQHLSVPEILKKVLNGLDVSYEILGTHHPRDYCVQYCESDFAFASRLMEEEGIFYFFKHTAKGHQLVVANTPNSHPDLPEQSKIVFEEKQGGTRARCRITEWEKVQELRSGKVTLWDHCFELPHKHLEAGRTIVDSVPVGKVNHKFKVGGNEQLEIYDYPGGYAQRFDGINRGGGERPADLQKIYEDNQRTAVIRVQQEALAGLIIQGAGYCRQFVSGHKFTLARHFDADGQYLITGVEHKAQLGGGFRSGDGAPVVYQNRFTCLPVALPFRPPQVTSKPRVLGTQTAVVVGPAGEEIFTDKYGRVKVQFHWDRQGKNDADSSCWVRVSQVWAGKRWGASFFPRVGQEVVVAFQEGDPDQPLVIGSVYNAEQLPPYLGSGPDANHRHDPKVSGIKSCTTAGGQGFNELRFDDSRGKEQVFLHAQRNLDVRVGADQMNTVAGSYHLRVGGDKDGQPQGDHHQVVCKDKHVFVQGEEVRCTQKDKHETVGGNRIEECRKNHSEKVAEEYHLRAKKVLIEADEEICLVVGGNFYRIDMTNGMTVVGLPKVKFNCGGSPSTSSAGELTCKKPDYAAAADVAKNGSPSIGSAGPRG
jgi:type VI secretion system secreted protein VgrG